MREFKDSISGDSKSEDEERPEITPQATTSAPATGGPEATSASGGHDTAAAQAPDRGSAEVGSKRDS
jgi:hypothetical protein